MCAGKKSPADEQPPATGQAPIAQTALSPAPTNQGENGRRGAAQGARERDSRRRGRTRPDTMPTVPAPPRSTAQSTASACEQLSDIELSPKGPVRLAENRARTA